MDYYLRERADGTLLMLDREGRVNGVLLDIDEAAEFTDDLDSDPRDQLLLDDMVVPTAA